MCILRSPTRGSKFKMNRIITWRWRVAMTFVATLTLMMNSVGAETHRNLLNKPAIKSIELEDGDIVDCVDIYKQPAFDHPLLKDHKIIMSPSFGEKMGNVAGKFSQQSNMIQSSWQRSEGCPQGTIPIRRVHNNIDLLGSASSKDFGTKVVSSGEVERAGRTLYVHGPYIGSQACLNVWAVWVEPDEWSQFAVELSDGKHKEDNNIVLEAGWTVNPRVFGDNRTRAYTYWTVDGYKSTGCYNLMCSGFVQTTSAYVIGGVIDHLSTFKGQQFCFNTTIYKDTSQSVWWLIMGGTTVGYWPMCLFKEHGGGGFDGATTLRWTGSVLNTNKGGQHTTTGMGSGHDAQDGWGEAAHIRDIQVMKDINDGFYEPSRLLSGDFADNALCYDYSNRFDDDCIFIGGPGRGSYCP